MPAMTPIDVTTLSDEDLNEQISRAEQSIRNARTWLEICQAELYQRRSQPIAKDTALDGKT